MSVVSLLGVQVISNPAKFLDKYQLEITFECLESLSKDLEWKLTYVGSANSSDYDQELGELLVGPIPVGVNKFIFEAEPPTVSKLPTTEILGVTVVLLTGSYDGREFVRVGYYVSNEYDTPELQNEPPSKPIFDRIVRNMLTEKPRVTRFAIKWDSEDSAPAEFPPEQPEADEAPDDADQYGADEAAYEEAIEQGDNVEVEVTEDVEMDVDMGGAPAVPADKIDEGAESEDLEAESSGESDEEDEAEGDDDAEMGDGDAEMGDASGSASAPQHPPAHA
ncbi:histone chaperone [Tricharina praecox]|uniref:histone chaperone n=1 Tax=Tricharina praecox TaxID=43433 RepID=UPI00221FE87B|nr:histone chaperone [Tricharina praecox]KAI5855447.1 histone chaperone [Tricharina praecox]